MKCFEIYGLNVLKIECHIESIACNEKQNLAEMSSLQCCPMCTKVCASMISVKVHIWKHHPLEAETLLTSVDKNTFKGNGQKIKVISSKESFTMMSVTKT